MFRGRARRFGRSRGKRTTAWLPGFSGFDDVAGLGARVLTLVGPIAGSTNTWGLASTLMGVADLPLRGGEGAVFTRAVGDLTFFAGLRNAGAGLAAATFPLRVVLAQHEQLPAGTFGEIFTTSGGLGDERILWMADTWVTSDTFTGLQAFDWDQPWRIHIEARAKRIVTEDYPVTLYMQTVLPAGTTAANFQCAGGIRILAKRPR